RRIPEEAGEADRQRSPALAVVLPLEGVRPQRQLAEDLVVVLERAGQHPQQRVNHDQRGYDQEQVLEQRLALRPASPLVADRLRDGGGGGRGPDGGIDHGSAPLVLVVDPVLAAPEGYRRERGDDQQQHPGQGRRIAHAQERERLV